jgi:2-oxoglutarate ferredoxin oxidoreductase subunit alpha
MAVDITLIIGGEAGQGIVTVGELVTATCRNAGFHLFANNEFESRIRGGHSFFQVRIGDHPVEAPCNKVHLIVALDARTPEIHKENLAEGGMILSGATLDNGASPSLVIPFEDMARKAGNKITANTVAAGACLGLLGAPIEKFKAVLSAQFKEKGEETLGMNLRAAELGYGAVSEKPFPWALPWSDAPPAGILINGAKAIALGAAAADCRVGAFYPMSPATDIMANLIALSEHLPLVVEQAEDEIAAMNMVIGASFAGARAMTATSGGGFCLMTEGLGLAGITETPVVIVNAQRPGPATGLPTRTAQADLLFCIHASQDEFPRFVFAPGTPAEAFAITCRAFDLSEKYQTPAIILADKFLTDSLFLSPALQAPSTITRYLMNSSEETVSAPYLRYAPADSGRSPRALPGFGNALVRAAGNEHSPDGHSSEDAANRKQMMDKRNAKWKAMAGEMKPPRSYHEGAEILLTAWGSTRGAVHESVDLLREAGLDAGALIFSDIWPFPAKDAAAAITQSKRFFMVEQNSRAQLGSLIREQTGLAADGEVLKYDGRPFYPAEIVTGILEQI